MRKISPFSLPLQATEEEEAEEEKPQPKKGKKEQPKVSEELSGVNNTNFV